MYDGISGIRTSCSVPRGRALDLLASKPRGGADHRSDAGVTSVVDRTAGCARSIGP